jgi:hypothetical protein
MDQSRLAAIPLFASLPEGELQAVAAVASERTLEKGETLTDEGSFGHGLFAIEEAPEAARRLRELLESRTMPPAVSG